MSKAQEEMNKYNSLFKTGVTYENLFELEEDDELPKVYFTANNSRVVAHGNTFAIKDQLKELNFKFIQGGGVRFWELKI